VRGKEGLKFESGVLWGLEPSKTVVIEEMSAKILVDIAHGHKTGFYIDQTDNRHLLSTLLSEDFAGYGRLLNLFSYTGGFGLHALNAGGAHVVNVDSSKDALELARQSLELNDFLARNPGATCEFIEADCFDYLHEAVKQRQQFDVVVLDPPKFAHNAGQVDKAARGYKDLNLNAFKIIKPGGYLMTFSCSGAISRDLFQKIVFGALADSGRQAQIVKHLSASDDHPIALTFPEGEYLKGLLLRVY
jgi:23S rRNA (cytosine1962-C5)-methyltransferase